MNLRQKYSDQGSTEVYQMNMGKAAAIFKDIHNEEIEVEDKLMAIDEVIGWATHNGITKKEMIEALRWLLEEYI